MTQSASKRLLLIHRYFWPEKNSAHGLMLKDIAEHHVRRGDDVRILTASVAGDGAASRQKWAAEQGVSIEEIDLLPDRGRPARHRVRSSLRFTARVIQAMMTRRYDAVLIGSYPFLITPAAALLIARLRRKRSLFYVQDILSSRLRRQGGVVSIVGRATSAIDRALVALSTVTVTLTEDMKQTLGSSKPVTLQNYLVDSATYTEQPNERVPTLIYAGNMGAAQGLDHLLHAATQAHKQRNFRLTLLGDGSLAEHLRQRIASEALTFATMHGPVSRRQADALIGQASVGIVASEPELYRSAFPSKTLSYLAQGLPVLLMCEPTIQAAQELVDAGVARIGSPTHASELAATIIELIDAAAAGQFNHTNIVVWTEATFGRDHYFARYEREVVPRWLDRPT